MQVLILLSYDNAFWFPQQTWEAAAYFRAQEHLEFAEIDPREIVSASRFSSSGFDSIHQWLAENGQLGHPSQSGSSCGV